MWPFSIWKVSMPLHLIVSDKMLGSLSPPRLTTPAGEADLSIAEEPVLTDLTRDQVSGGWRTLDSRFLLRTCPFAAMIFYSKKYIFSTRIWPSQEVLGSLELRFRDLQCLCYFSKSKDACVILAKGFRDRDIYEHKGLANENNVF